MGRAGDPPGASAPWADLPEESLRARLLPGDGAIDLVAFLRALDAIGCRAPLGAEVFSAALSAQDPVTVGRRAGDALRKLIGAAAAGSESAPPSRNERPKV